MIARRISPLNVMLATIQEFHKDNGDSHIKEGTSYFESVAVNVFILANYAIYTSTHPRNFNRDNTLSVRSSVTVIIYNIYQISSIGTHDNYTIRLLKSGPHKSDAGR